MGRTGLSTALEYLDRAGFPPPNVSSVNGWSLHMIILKYVSITQEDKYCHPIIKNKLNY
jgi:hypothetical protein